jgi:RNA polymerase sigma-70 factor (ECF subfamily)
MASDRNNTSIQRLIDDHLDAVYRYAYRLTGGVHDAEDLTQQVFLLAQQRLDQLREVEQARGWLFAILLNCFLKMAQRTQPVSATSVGLNLEAVPAGGKNGEVGKESSQAVDNAELQAAVDELPAEFCVVLAMFYFEDCSYREMAEKLDLPMGTVMSRLAKARGHLRSKLFETEQAGKKPAPAR